MTEVRVQTIEIRQGNDWIPEYQIGAFKDGNPENYEKGNFYWKTVVWAIDDLYARGNAHDRVLHTNGGHFNIYKFRFVDMIFDPEKHHLTERKQDP